jgi:predicted enzyme related to lactoylglutathione lyase
MTDTNHGRFVWYDLLTADTKAAIAFYGEVVGWKAQQYGDSHYSMWVGNAGPLGGVMQLPEEAKKMGAPPHWMANVEVANVDQTLARVRELGGKVYKEPEDIPEIGRFAVIADPQGAVISVFTPAREMASLDPDTHGHFHWNELATTDNKAAFAFYHAIFGWEHLSDFDMGPMGNYMIFGRGGKQLGGMMIKPKEMPGPAMFLYYVQVDHLEDAIARATKMGAKVLNGPMQVPASRRPARIAQLMDPQGVAFALHEYTHAKG